MENFNEYCLPQRDFFSNDGEVLTELKTLVNKLDKCFKKDSDNFAEICFVVYRIKNLFDDYKQVWVRNREQRTYNFDTIMTGFGICKSDSSKILSCYDKYCCLSCSDLEIAKCSIIEEFKGFSKSKLFELLQVPNEQIVLDLQNKVLRFDMSVKSIRDYVKNYQTLQKQNLKLTQQEEAKQEDEEIEEDIPEAYDPKKHYDFNYFEEKTKAQLLNIVWQLQTEYEKLKKEKNKK